MSTPQAFIAEIEAIEAEVEMVRTCVRAEGRTMSAVERDYLDELLLERAAIYRTIKHAQAQTVARVRQRAIQHALQRESAVCQMQVGALAVASGGMLTALASPGPAPGALLLILGGGIALGGVRFVRGLSAYLRR